jgi:NitT/TauT family transport system substrate-binding protein
MDSTQSRRHFLATLSASCAANALGARGSLADEGQPEVTTIRLRRDPSICVAPWYIAEDLLRAEGFTDIRYVPTHGPETAQMMARGELDFGVFATTSLPVRLDAGAPIAAIAGMHAGCFELFAHDHIRTISDLKGKKVGIDVLGSAKFIYVSVMVASVGLDPHKDIEWVESSATDPMALFPRSCSPNGKSMRFLLSPRATGAARPSRRSRDPQHLHGQAVVPVLLLHGGGKQEVR